MSQKRLRVGVIGAGEVAQVIHLPTLSLLSHIYETVFICDISQKNVDHCKTKFRIPYATTDPYTLINSPEVDVVFALTSDEHHAPYTVAALKADKHVMVEKPVSLSIPSVEKIIEAEKQANGARVFVGYMRRYAPSFVNTFKREVASIPKILYARSRDIIGPNSHFVGQSGTFPVQNADFPIGSGEQRDKLVKELLDEAFEGREVTPEMQKYCRFLGGLGSHDLSLMREALGFPESVAGVTVNDPFYTAMFNYRNRSGEPFAVTYESGVDAVPRFDAHLAVYGEKKTISIKYDTPYVKGLPIVVTVESINEHGEAESKQILSSFEDAYTAELKELHLCLTTGAEIKTSVKDALNELKLYDMMYKKWLA